MATIDVDHLSVFAAVVRTGSFTAAARELGTQKAHTSRVVGRLERALGVQLLHRSTRSLAVTEVGRELYERTLVILGALDDTEAAIQNAKGEPYGTLRLTCGVEFAPVSGWITRYLQLYPRMRVDADYTNRLVDLIHEGFDLAIRVGQLADAAGLSARRLGEVRYALYASPAYLKRRPKLAHAGTLTDHALIMFTPVPAAAARWSLGNGAERVEIAGPWRLQVNSHMAAVDAAAHGLGIALLPRIRAEPAVRGGRLVEALPGWTRSPVPMHAVFASSRYLAPKVRAFIDLAQVEARNL